MPIKLKIVDSSKKNKRFTALFREGDKLIKVIQFGSKGSKTYIDHADTVKRKNYLARHKVNEDWTKAMNAGSLSRWLLWGDNKTLASNLKSFKSKFKLG